VLAGRLYADEEARKAATVNQDFKVVAVDLQEMAAIEGVAIIQGDITTEETLKAIMEKFKGNKAELVVCDGAPDITGFHEIDQYLQAQLLQAALTITTKMLQQGGTFCAKFFRMSDLAYLQAMMKPLFRDVYVVKPESSRSSSAEAFVVGLGYLATGNL
jgi:tRNA (cytidine32/guanosine34-2'-O)-methyltransferase